MIAAWSDQGVLMSVPAERGTSFGRDAGAIAGEFGPSPWSM